MTAAGLAAAIGAVVLGVGSLVGWSEHTQAGSPAPAAGAAPLAGASLFTAKGCATCHDGPDTTAMIDGFPSLADVASFAGSRRPGYGASEYVSESIRDPGAFTSPDFHGAVGPTTQMPNLAVAPAEVDALVAYLLHD